MCLMTPQGEFECTNHYRGTCHKIIQLDKIPDTVGECYDRLVSAGWVVVPHTGTFIYCSEECYRSAGWGEYGDQLRWPDGLRGKRK